MKLFRLLQQLIVLLVKLKNSAMFLSVTAIEELKQEYIKSIESLENPGTTINGGFHVMGSEDFAVISAKIPASYFVVGAGVEDQSKWKGQHNPKILFNEKALPLGAAMYAKIAMDWLAK